MVDADKYSIFVQYHKVFALATRLDIENIYIAYLFIF